MGDILCYNATGSNPESLRPSSFNNHHLNHSPFKNGADAIEKAVSTLQLA
jgi:hypothetical protein